MYHTIVTYLGVNGRGGFWFGRNFFCFSLKLRGLGCWKSLLAFLTSFSSTNAFMVSFWSFHQHLKSNLFSPIYLYQKNANLKCKNIKAACVTFEQKKLLIRCWRNWRDLLCGLFNHVFADAYMLRKYVKSKLHVSPISPKLEHFLSVKKLDAILKTRQRHSCVIS